MFYLSFLLAILIFLTYNVNTQNNLLVNTDDKVLTFFHTLQSKTMDIFFSTITWLGSLWILLPSFVILIIYLLSNGYKNLVYGLSIGFFGSIATTYAIKYLLERKRPDIFDTIGDLPFDPSFPSAHTTQVFIVVFLLSFLVLEFEISNKVLLISSLFLVAVLVASSRMYLQVHFFTDVIAGFIVASIWIYIAVSFIRAKGGV